MILLWEGDGALDPQQLAEIGDRIEQATTIAEDAGALVGEASPPIPSRGRRGGPGRPPVRPRPRRRPARRSSPSCAASTASTARRRTSPARAPLLRLRRRLLRHRRPAAARRVRRRPADPAGRLPQPAAAVPRHRHRRPGAHRLASPSPTSWPTAGWIAVNGQSQGIASILVVGAATDYGLLLVARYREELRQEQSKYAAMRIALRQSWEPIVASRRHGHPRRPLPALLRPRLQPRPRPDLRGQRRPRHARRAHLPARRPRCCSAAPRSGRSGRSTAPSTAHGRGWERVAQLVGRRPAAGAALERSARCSSLAVVRAHLRRRRHPAVRGGARRLRVGDRARRPSAGTSTPAPPARR